MYTKELDVRKTTSYMAGGQFGPSGIGAEYETEEEQNVLADYLRRSSRRIIELQFRIHRGPTPTASRSEGTTRWTTEIPHMTIIRLQMSYRRTGSEHSRSRN